MSVPRQQIEERVLVRCFLVLQTFNSISSALPEYCPMTMPAVYFFTRSDKQGTTLLCSEQTVGDGLTGLECNQGTLFTILDISTCMVHSH